MKRPAPILELVIPGLPVPQGSKRHVGNGRMIESNDAQLRPWRSTVALEAARELELTILPATRDAVRVSLAFEFPRPSSHFGTGRNAGELKASAPAYKTTKPDVDKLARAVLDALTGIAFADDAQVAELAVVKRFGPARAIILVEFADEFTALEVPSDPVTA